MKLSTRLMMAMVALVLLTATTISIFSYRNIELIVLPRALERIKTQATLLATEIESHIKGARGDILSFRSAAALEGIVSARLNGGTHPVDGTSEAVWRARMASRYAAELESKPDYLQFRFIGLEDDGREIVRVDRAGPNGSIRIVPDEDLQQKGESEYMRAAAAMRALDVYISPVDLNREPGEIGVQRIPVMRVATPVHTAAGVPFGILVINIDMRPAFSRLRAATPANGVNYLVNEQGDYLLHPDPNREFGFEYSWPNRIQDDFAGLAAALNDNETALIITDPEGMRLGAAVAPVRLLGIPRIYVVQTEPYSYLVAPATAARHGSLVVGFVSMLAALALAALISRSLARPLVEMTNAVQRFGRGETTTIPLKAGGEFGVLARAFAQMATEVWEKSSALQREIAERRRIFENSLDLILVVDRRGTILQVSPSSSAILGYDPEEMIGKGGARFLHPGDLDATRMEMRAARQSGEMRNFECRYLHKDGRTITLVWNGVWSEIAQQHFFTGRDVTEQKLGEEKFELAVEACPSGMMMTDQNGAIAMVNTEVERMFGYRRAELIGQPVDILIPARLRDQHRSHRSDFASQPESRHMGTGRDLFALRKDGTEFPVEVGLNPIDSRDGLMILSVIVDITERKRHERLKDEFVATVSHELRTPLTSIGASLGLLTASAAGGLSDNAIRLLRIAHSNSQRLIRLINDILDIEKLESGKMVFKLKPVEIRGLVEQTIEANRGFASSFDVTMGLKSDLVSGLVLADPDRLNQIVTNLVSNAVKFSPAQGEVDVSIEVTAAGFRISVRDRGPGIPDDYKDRVFEKFVQVDATDARQKGGTGLGLAIVKQMVERLGGAVGFRAGPDGGTIFDVDLPAWEPVAEPAPAIPYRETARILLCEDDPQVAEVISDRLRQAGFESDISHSAEAAVKDAAAISYAAILVDLQLPDSDGITLIKRLRTQPHYHNTPIIVVSADPKRGRDDTRSSALNVLDWLSKPVDIDRLVRVLDRPIVRLTRERPRILHVDNDRDVLHLVARALASSADVMSVESIAGARAVLGRDHFDLAVLDVVLAEGFGLDLLPDLHNPGGEAIPVVVLSAQDTPEVTARVLAVLSKTRAPIDSLVATLRGFVDRRPAVKIMNKEVA